MTYKIELTDAQLNIVIRAVNLMMRTGTGQTDDLTEWLVTKGDSIKFDTSTEEGKLAYENYISTRGSIRPVLDGVMRGCWKYTGATKPDMILELETVYDALRHQEWLDDPTKLDLNAMSDEVAKNACAERNEK